MDSNTQDGSLSCPASRTEPLSAVPTSNSSINVTHRTDRSLRTGLLQVLLRPLRGWILQPGDPYPPGSPRLTVPKSTHKTCQVTERRIGSLWAYDVQAHQPDASSGSISTSNNSSPHNRPRTRKHNSLAAHVSSTTYDLAHSLAETDAASAAPHLAPAGTSLTPNLGRFRDRSVRRVVYVAGGSWRAPPSGQHWRFVAKLAAGLEGETVVTVLSVPLAPRETAPSAFPRLLEAYEVVMREADERGERVVWAGDSSGANIVLGLVGEALRVGREKGEGDGKRKGGEDGQINGHADGDAHSVADTAARTKERDYAPQEKQRSASNPLPAPSALLLICPSVDARRSNPDIPAIEKLDPLLVAADSQQWAADWVGAWSLDDERVSPAAAGDESRRRDNVATLLQERGVHVHGVTAGYDILSPDALVLRERLNEAGVEGKWLQWERQMHCFPLAWIYGLPESAEAVRWCLDVLAEE